jgi:hypothetical protein
VAEAGPCVEAIRNNFLLPTVHSLVIVLQGSIAGGQPQAGDDLVELCWFGQRTNCRRWPLALTATSLDAGVGGS